MYKNPQRFTYGRGHDYTNSANHPDQFATPQLICISCAETLPGRNLAGWSCEASADAIGLRVIGLGPSMFNIIERQIELIIMSLWFTGILGTAIGQNTDQAHAMLCKEWEHLTLSRSVAVIGVLVV